MSSTAMPSYRINTNYLRNLTYYAWARQGSVAEAAFHHAGDIVGGEAAVAEPSGLAKGSPEQRCIRRRILESGRSEVGGEDFFKIAAEPGSAATGRLFRRSGAEPHRPPR